MKRSLERCPKCNASRLSGKACGRCLVKWSHTAPLSDAEALKVFRDGQRLHTEAIAYRLQTEQIAVWCKLGLTYTVKQIRTMTPDTLSQFAHEAYRSL